MTLDSKLIKKRLKIIISIHKSKSVTHSVLFKWPFYQKGSDVWGKDGCIDDQEEDDPIPERFERRVVQNGPFVDSRGLQFVLGHHLSSQR